jgi:hypothetical protein
MLAIKIEDSTGLVGLLAANPTDFKTGSRGYRGIGKVTIAGKRYQTSIQLVEIHSKPNGAGTADAEPEATEE